MAAPAKMAFYVWVTVLTDGFTEQLIGRLVRRNWEVSSLGNTLSLRNDDNLATLLAFSMAKTPKSDKAEDEVTQSKALDEVKDVLKRLELKYHSLIVVAGAPGCTWCLGNITKSGLEKLESEAKKGFN